MLNKIFNRKYYKAIKEIEADIEAIRGREDYYKAELRMGLPYDQVKEAVRLAEMYEARRKALEMSLFAIKMELH